MKDKFEEVSTDVIEAISQLHYEDKEKEIMKLKVMLVFCKMMQSQKTFDEDTLTLDKNHRRKF